MKTDTLYLAIDQGGHASRAAAIDSRGNILSLHAMDIDTQRRGDDVVEHDADQVVESLHHVIRCVVADLDQNAECLAGAGLATQRSNVVSWDRHNGRALSPIISWQDRRGRQWLEGLAANAEWVRRRTGLTMSAHYGASKLRWCLDHLPSVRAAAGADTLAWGPMASFLAYRLLEERPLLADPVNAARTLLYNPGEGDWDEELLRLFGLPARPLPRCVPNRYAYGHIGVEGLHIPLTVVTGDQSASLFSMGWPDFKAVYVNTGTGVFLQQCRERPANQTALLQSIVWKDPDTCVYALEGTINGGGAALHREAARLGIDDMEARLPEWLEHHGQPPLFLNGIGGLGSPFWRAQFPSRYIGAADAAACLVAVVESIVFLIQRNLEIFVAAGRTPERLVISGGLAQLDGLCMKLAGLSRVSVCRTPNIEATLCGLGFLMAGLPAGYSRPSWQQVFEPRPDPSLESRYKRWRAAMEQAVESASRP